MQVTLSSATSNKLEQILDYLYTRFDVDELRSDELIDVLINHSLQLLISDEDSLNECRDKLVESCMLKSGMNLGTGVKFEESDEYRG